jgi:hypothetical protein
MKHLLSQKHKMRRRLDDSAALSMLSILLLLLLTSTPTSYAQQQQDPRTLNGGSVLVMSGKGCVALAVDKRFGSGPQVCWMLKVLFGMEYIPNAAGILRFFLISPLYYLTYIYAA